MMKLLVYALALLLAFPAVGQRSKKTIEETPVLTVDGLTYHLPRTGIRVVVTATRTDFVAGPYALYAESLLGIQNVKNQSRISWNIDAVEVVTFAEPDPEHRYKTGNMNASLLQLSPTGCLSGINAVMPPAEGPQPAVNAYTLPAPATAPAFTRLTNNTDLTGRSPLEQRAAAAAAAILKARSARLDIVTGMLDEFHPDGEAYEESLEELRKIEKSNLELFTGKASHQKYTFSYDFIPAAKGTKGEVIFRFDETLGFLPKSDFSGKPVMIDVEPAFLPAADNTSAAASPGSATNPGAPMAPASASASATASGSGLFFRQPAIAEIRISRELTLLATTRLPIAQMGSVLPLPAELLNGNYAIQFWPETGAIKSVTKNQ